MIFLKTIRTWAFIVNLVLVTIQPVFAESFNRVVAIVNVDVITLFELDKKIKELTGLSLEEAKSRDPQGFPEIQRNILGSLIDEKLALKKIKELNIRVTNSQVEAAIERIKANNRLSKEEFLVRLEKEGMTYERYQERVKRDLERLQLVELEVKSRIIIKEEAIRQYYQNHKDEFGTADNFHLGSIFLLGKNPGDEAEIKDLQKKGEEILDRLQEGENFAELARRFSTGPGANEGGDLGFFKADQLEPDLQKLLDTMPEGGFTGLIVRPNGFQIIKLLKKELGILKPFEEVKGAISEILFQDEVDRRYEAWIKDMREKSYLKITL